jgi:hypothetical protein
MLLMRSNISSAREGKEVVSLKPIATVIPEQKYHSKTCAYFVQYGRTLGGRRWYR